MILEDRIGQFAIARSPQRYELRLLQKEDAAAMFALTEANRAYLRQWLPWLDAIEGVNDTQNFIEHTRQQAIDLQGFVAAIWELRELDSVTTDRIVGVIGLNRIAWRDRIGDVGYWLGAADGGRGMMTNACKVLVDYAFSTLNLNRLVIACATQNHRSRAIPVRLGFEHEGIVREAEWLYDRFVDHEIYALLKRDWHSRDIETSDRHRQD